MSDLSSVQRNAPIVLGQPRFSDPALAEIARNQGPLAAWQRAFERDGAKAAAGVRGSFAVAFFDAEAERSAVDPVMPRAIAGIGCRHDSYHLRQEAIPLVHFGCRDDDIAKRLDFNDFVLAFVCHVRNLPILPAQVVSTSGRLAFTGQVAADINGDNGRMCKP